MEEPSLAGLVKFCMAQDPERVINDDSYGTCAVGEYLRKVGRWAES